MLSFFPRGVLGEILKLIESVSEGFSSYTYVCPIIESDAWPNRVELKRGAQLSTVKFATYKSAIREQKDILPT